MDYQALIEIMRQEINEPNDEVCAKVKLARLYCYLNNIPFGYPEDAGNRIIEKAHQYATAEDWNNDWLG